MVLRMLVFGVVLLNYYIIRIFLWLYESYSFDLGGCGDSLRNEHELWLRSGSQADGKLKTVGYLCTYNVRAVVVFCVVAGLYTGCICLADRGG